MSTKKPSLPIMISYGRSGSTLLNRCLGALPNTYVLAEVNPVASSDNRDHPDINVVAYQAKEWFDIDIEADGFVESVLELKQKAEAKGKRLVVRDWSFVNFVPLRLNGQSPANELLTITSLAPHTQVAPFAFVRNLVDMWISSGMPEIEQYSKCYAAYAEAIVEMGMPVFTYEEFCQDPQTVMKGICAAADLEYDAEFQRSFVQNKQAVGDFFSMTSSSGIQTKKRGRISRRKIEMLMGCDRFVKANAMFGYSSDYFDTPVESRWKSLQTRSRKILARPAKALRLLLK